MRPAHVLRGDVPGALLDPSHQGELDVWPLVDGHRHGDQVEYENGKPLDEKTLPTTDQGTIWHLIEDKTNFDGVGKFANVHMFGKCEHAN